MTDGTADEGVRSSRTTGRTWALLALGLILAAGLRLSLAGYSLWIDEYASLYFASRPMHLLWGRWMVIETNPPLFYTLLKGWVALGAHSIISLRLLPILAGLVQVTLLGVISHRWFGTRAAVVALVLAAVAPQNIFYSHLVRGYIFAVDGVLVSLVGLLLIAEQPRRPHRLGWALHVAGSLFAIYCHTTMFLWPAIAAIGLVCLGWRDMMADRGRLFRHLVAASALVALGSAWWLYISFLQINNGIPNLSWNKPIGPREFLRQVMDAVMLAWDQYDRDKLVTDVVALLTLAGAAMTWKNRAARFLTILFASSLLLFCLAGMKSPIIVQRTIYWMSIFPILLIAAWLGSVRIAALRWGVLAALSLLLLNNLRLQHARFEHQDWTGALTTVAAHPDSVLLVQGPQMEGLLAAACWVQFSSTHCPFRIVRLPFGPLPGEQQRAAQRHLAAAYLRRRLDDRTPIYVMHSYTFNPLGLFTPTPDEADDRFFFGPVTREQITRLAD